MHYHKGVLGLGGGGGGNDKWRIGSSVLYGPMNQARNDFLPVNARSRGRLGLRLDLLYSRKATALAGAEREVWSQGYARLWPKALRTTLGHTLS